MHKKITPITTISRYNHQEPRPTTTKNTEKVSLNEYLKFLLKSIHMTQIHRQT